MRRNDAARFGLSNRPIHWAMAVLILLLLVLGTQLKIMQPGLANLWLYGLHKTLGLTALALVLIRRIWHRISPPALPIGPPKAWEVQLARAVHLLTCALLVLIRLDGWACASAIGLDIRFANTWVIPPIAPVTEAWGNVAIWPTRS